MYQRPKSDETEEDLLRMQEEFFKDKAENKLKPAAKIARDGPVSQISSSEISTHTTLNDSSEGHVKEQLANTFEDIPKDIKLKNIEEKVGRFSNSSQVKFPSSRGFPQAKRRDPSISSGKGSIFSQHMKKIKRNEQPMEVDIFLPSTVFQKETITEPKEKATCSAASYKSAIKRISLPTESYILTGSESKQIHEENINKIKDMSEAEILEEREKLLSTMDPAIVAFLKSRRKKDIVQNRNPTIKEQNEAAENINLEEIETPSELLTNPAAEKWINFDIVESNKLAWMRNVEIPTIDKNKAFEARFDFEGWLLPYTNNDINDKNRILYHHGDDAGRPGYTLQELFQLSRSSVIQQKIIALNCIANIIALSSVGIYDGIIEIPIEQIFFVVRFCLDDNAPAVLNAAIKAMRNLVYFKIDEICLDNLLGYGLGLIQPTLAVDEENEDDNTVNDQQLVETNIVKCMARTEILTRIRYIFNTVRPLLETLVYCFEILIRLARDSNYILNKILSCDGLLDCITKHFVPSSLPTSTDNDAYGLPLIYAIKFLRILCSRKKDIASALIKKYKIMDSIANYLTDETFSLNANGLHLQVECMHFWRLLIYYDFSLECIHILERPVLMKMLNYHFYNTDLNITTTLVRQSHVAALLNLLSQIITKEINLNSNILEVLHLCFEKWSHQFGELNDFACGKLQIISSLFLTVKNVKGSDLKKILDSKGFNIVTKNIRNGSMLLNNYETHKASANLRSVEASAWHTMDHVVPVLQSNSCLPFLYCLSTLLTKCDNDDVKIHFLKHPHIQEYLFSLQGAQQYYLTSNWFTRIESFTLLNIFKLAVDVMNQIDTTVFYEIAVKSLCTFHSDQKPGVEYLLNNIIFCPKFYPSDVLLVQLNINDRTDNFELAPQNLDDVLKVYIQVLGLRKGVTNFTTNVTLDINIGNVIPVDWIYTPIIVLYSSHGQNKNTIDENDQIFIIKNCLRWILIYETHFPTLAASINTTDRFCRLACVFLGSDSLFLNEDIHRLLELCFKNLIQFENDLNFKKDILGLSNFQDFYTQLLEQYQGVSYGDVLFGNVILVPLAQKHDVQYRKTLWSEYMGVVQTFNVTEEQMMSNIHLFLDPYETDLSLLSCYARAIANNLVRNHTVLYKIAKHHIDKTIIRQTVVK